MVPIGRPSDASTRRTMREAQKPAPRIGSRGVEVSLKSITRSLEDWEQRGLRRVAMRAFHATSDMQPNEVVEIALPKLDESMGVFAGRSYAIRIRAKVR